ncbi:MAG TPA: GGDEF domain-containing protein [Spirochaetia bacterium]|nr:GGDEF domain-containing protein [Spirochaetia bacterium]
MEQSYSILRSVDIFSNLTDEELSVVRSCMEERVFHSVETLFNEGDPGDELFVVLNGAVSISVRLADGEELSISEAGTGSFFGEMSIFEHAPRSATCRTKGESTLLCLKGSDFFTLIDTHPSIAVKIMYRMLQITTDRLKKTGNFLSDMVQWGAEARKRAVTDDFTGLFNRRFFDTAIEDKFREAAVNGLPLSLAMVDLDHFGSLNKEHGEQVCNSIILAAVGVFRTVFGERNILVRYGGDEFSFILSGMASAEAKEKCSTVCSLIRELTVLDDLCTDTEHGLPRKMVTASIGIASYPEHAQSVKELLEKSDAALYRAKEEGRDRAVAYKNLH